MKNVKRLVFSSIAVYGVAVVMVIVLCVGIVARVYSLRDEINARGGLRQSVVDAGRSVRNIMNDIKTDDPNEQPDPNSIEEQ